MLGLDPSIQGDRSVACSGPSARGPRVTARALALPPPPSPPARGLVAAVVGGARLGGRQGHPLRPARIGGGGVGDRHGLDEVGLELRLPRGLDLLNLADRSEEPTSALQSLMRISYNVFCMKKKRYYDTHDTLR